MARARGLLAGILVVFVLFPAAKYIALRSNVMDLGVFVHQIALLDGGEWQAALSGHLQGYSLALTPIMSAFTGAGLPVGIGVVAIQALLLILPAFIFLRIAGIWVALAYVAYSPVWINAHFDFHYDHLAIPLLLGFYLGLRSGRLWWTFLFASLLVFVKEPFALQTAACGLLVLLMPAQGRGAGNFHQGQEAGHKAARQGRSWRAGVALVIVGSAYFYFATHFALPYFAPANWGVFRGEGPFSWLGNGLGEIAGNMVTHPLDILEEVLTRPGKLAYLFVVFGLLAFIPLLAPSYLIPALPLLAIGMLSRLPNYYDYNTHYTAGLIVPVMFAFIQGLPKAHALWMRGGRWVLGKAFVPRANTCVRPDEHPQLLAALKDADPLLTMKPLRSEPNAGEGFSLEMISEVRLSKAFYALLALWIFLGHVMISPSPISRLFWSDKVWSRSWRAYVPTEREAMMKVAMLEYIPADPSVSVTTQNTVNWEHLARREVYAPFPMGVIEPIRVSDWSNRTWDGFWRFVHTSQMPPGITHDRYADYVVLDLKRPWFIVDKGCDWLYGACRNADMATEFLRLMDETRQRYDTIFERDGFMVLRRKGAE